MIGTLQLASQSLQLDRRILAATRLPLGWRLRFIIRKYVAILSLSRQKPVLFAIGTLRVRVKSISSLGTLQSSITDFYDDIVLTNIIDRSDPLILDLGANIGQFCNAAKLFFPRARIVSFEPDPDVFAELMRNTERLSDVQLFNIGLGEKAEALPFYRHTYSVMSTFAKGATDANRYRSETIELQICRLDDIMGPELRPDLVKIDVEGFEHQAVLGGQAVLERSKWLILELSLGRDRSTSASNFNVLRDINSIAPYARIVKFGRALGFPSEPVAQDILIRLTSLQGAGPSGPPSVPPKRQESAHEIRMHAVSRNRDSG